MSVNIDSILAANGHGPEACLADYPIYKLVAISAGVARQHDQAVCHDPLPDNLSHGLVYGPKTKRSVFEGLRNGALWIIPAVAPLYEE